MKAFTSIFSSSSSSNPTTSASPVKTNNSSPSANNILDISKGFSQVVNFVATGATDTPPNDKVSGESITVIKKQTDFYENEDSFHVITIDEFERFKNGMWSPNNLTSEDPMRYKSSEGPNNDFPILSPPEGWQFEGNWHIEDPKHVSEKFNSEQNQTRSDQEIWYYSTNFLELSLGHYFSPNETTLVRKKIWIRKIAPISLELPEPTPEPTPEPIKNEPPVKSFLEELDEQVSSNQTKDEIASVMQAEENFEFEYEMDETMTVNSDVTFTNQSVSPLTSSSSNIMPNTSKRRNSLFTSFATNPSTSPNIPDKSSTANKRLSLNLTNQPSQRTSTSVFDPVLKLQSTTLSMLGKQIKLIEQEIKKQFENDQKIFKDKEKIDLEKKIQQLEKEIQYTKQKMEILSKSSLNQTNATGLNTNNNPILEQLNQLEKELNDLLTKIEIHKHDYYLPTSPIKLGQGGVYLGLNDFWLEYLSGQFSVQLMPDKHTPQIQVHLHSYQEDQGDGGIKTAAPSNKGVTTKIKLEGFKLVGEKGKSIPKLNFDSLKITIAFEANITLFYDMKLSRWTTNSKHFHIKILSFKGPYGLNRSIVGLVVSLITPTIRNLLTQNLPYELGLLIRTFPSPFSITGAFDIQGLQIDQLSTEWNKSFFLQNLCDLTPLQMEMFIYLQRALDRSPTMKTMGDFITYVKFYSKYKGMWHQLVNIWQQSCQLYCEKIAQIKQDNNPSVKPENYLNILPEYSFTFDHFLQACEDILSKKIQVKFKLQNMDGQISLNHMISFIYQIVHRLTADCIQKGKISNVERVRLMAMIDRIRINYEFTLKLLKIISNNMDFAQLTLQTFIQTGEQGLLHVRISDLMAQAPVLFKMNLLEPKNLGVLPLVPYILSMKPCENGDLFMEVHYFTHDASDVPELMQKLTQKEADDPLLTNFENSISTGCYMTSYNRLVTNITSGNFIARNPPPQDIKSLIIQYEQDKQQDILLHNEERISNMIKASRQQKQIVQNILQNHPVGNEADRIINIIVHRPHVSMVVDQTITLKPGAELFTFLLGFPDKGWKPFGALNRYDEAEEINPLPPPTSSSVADDENSQDQSEKQRKSSLSNEQFNEMLKGMPIFVQTAPGIKFLMQVPSADIHCNLSSIFRFLLAHFADLQLFKSHLQTLFGGEVLEEHLSLAKTILEMLSKYLLIPGIMIQVNLNGKIVALNQEIMIRIETPEDFDVTSSNPPPVSKASFASSASNGTTNNKPEPQGPCAILIEAQFSLQELFDDSRSLEKLF